MDRLGVMEVFVLAVETGSFSAVARRLGMGQPTVSRLIAQLEAHLGSRLLLRSTRGLAPTEAGEAYYLRAREILAQVNEADAMVQQCRAGLSGRLRVSAPVTFARLHIIPHLAGFLAAHPGLDLEILLDDGNVDLISAGMLCGSANRLTRRWSPAASPEATCGCWRRRPIWPPKESLRPLRPCNSMIWCFTVHGPEWGSSGDFAAASKRRWFPEKAG